MQVFIEKEQKKKKLEFKGTAQQLLIQLDINPETVLVVKNGELITEEDSLANTDEVKLVSVISGG